jgi:hypothetical protein
MTGSGCVIGLVLWLREGEESYDHIQYSLDQLSPKANLWHKLTVGQMSELGHSLPKSTVRVTSALPPIATELRTSLVVRFVPFPDSCTATDDQGLR